MENSRDVSVGDLIYGSDAYYGQVTRIGGSVVEFTTVGLMPTGPKGDQGDQGPEGPQGPQGPVGPVGEVAIKDLPGVNLAIPDLSTATYLGDGVYRLYNKNGITIDYNVYNGNFVMNGSLTITTLGDIFRIPMLEDGLTYTISAQEISGTKTGLFAVYIRTPLQLLLTMVPNQNTFVAGNNNNYIILSDFSIGSVFDNYTFIIQLEKGDTATPYTLPGQIPEYATKEQEAWITPTLINGADGTIRYMKDSLGFVHIEGLLNRGTSGPYLRLPVGYRPFETLRIVTYNQNNETDIATINSGGDIYGGGYIYQIYKGE